MPESDETEVVDADDARSFRLTIRALPDPLAEFNGGAERSPVYRLRQLLKPLLRANGFRCVSVGPESLADAKPTPEPPQERKPRRKSKAAGEAE